MNSKSILCNAVCLLGLMVTAFVSARAASPDSCTQNIIKAVHQSNTMAGSQTLDSKLDFGPGGASCMVALILASQNNGKHLTLTLPELETAFNQLGSSSGTGGSTNLVAKGTTAKVLSAAAEYGALTESTSNQTVTFRGTLAGIPTLLQQKKFLSVCSSVGIKPCFTLTTFNALNRLSYSVGFDTSQGSTPITGTVTGSTSQSTAVPATLTANTHTFNSASVKYVLRNGQAPSPKEISDALAKAASAANPDTNNNLLQTYLEQLMNDCQISEKWRKETKKELLSAANDAEIQRAWTSAGVRLIEEVNDACPAKGMKDARSYADAFSASLADDNKLYESLRAQPMLTIEYDYSNPANKPSYSTVEVVGQLNKKGVTGSLNAAGAFYTSQPSASIPESSRIRDFQIAGELAYDLSQSKTASFLGQSTVSGAYYYQDQTSPAILNATPSIITGLPSSANQVFAKRGVINIGQFKFNFIRSNSKINIPFSVTWSNRTELVTHSVWRGQLGISYNFDSLFSSKQ